MQKFKVEIDDMRLDNYLSLKTDISRSKIQSLIKEGNILVNEKEEKSSYKVRVDDETGNLIFYTNE